MLRLVVLGPHTRLLSSVCAACPHSPAGCCVAPPTMDWSDVGRIVALGGDEALAWLEGEICARNLVPHGDGLALRKAKGLARPDGPKLAKCVYHAQDGCVVGSDRRPATCNYYVCESVYVDDRAAADEARAVHASLARAFTAWDAELGARVRASHPDGPPWDRAFLRWLGAAFLELSARVPDASSSSASPCARLVLSRETDA